MAKKIGVEYWLALATFVITSGIWFVGAYMLTRPQYDLGYWDTGAILMQTEFPKRDWVSCFQANNLTWDGHSLYFELDDKDGDETGFLRDRNYVVTTSTDFPVVMDNCESVKVLQVYPEAGEIWQVTVLNRFGVIWTKRDPYPTDMHTTIAEFEVAVINKIMQLMFPAGMVFALMLPHILAAFAVLIALLLIVGGILIFIKERRSKS